ncbi:hypothetical protein AVEN_69608-1 [Araneus ventricosus]|uniref:Uncharacterized protein n=1 Tax=Araneus ventricosus TaxID=182803 RepID=A0A4Y2GA01_ARAVE|nr:hypothetical protein AVEN_69608-1 [Araneus ventricosus]
MFFQESFSSSVDFPTYIPWQTLSSDLSDKLKHGSIRINRSNRVEYATIQEEGTPLLENGSRKPDTIGDGSIVTEAVRAGNSTIFCQRLVACQIPPVRMMMIATQEMLRPQKWFLLLRLSLEDKAVGKRIDSNL